MNIISNVVNQIKDIYASFPEWFDSLFEFLIVWVSSNVPYIALIFIHILGTSDATLNFDTALSVIKDNIQPGEVLIYVSTLMAPFVYVLVQYVRARKYFPYYGLYLLITALIYCSCLIVFSMYKNGTLQNHEFVSNNAMLFYTAALALWYFALVFGRMLSKPDSTMGSNAQSIIDSFDEGENK